MLICVSLYANLYFKKLVRLPVLNLDSNTAVRLLPVTTGEANDGVLGQKS